MGLRHINVRNGTAARKHRTAPPWGPPWKLLSDASGPYPPAGAQEGLRPLEGAAADRPGGGPVRKPSGKALAGSPGKAAPEALAEGPCEGSWRTVPAGPLGRRSKGGPAGGARKRGAGRRPLIDPFRGGRETVRQTLGEKGHRRDPRAVGDAGPAGRRGPRGRAGTTHLKHPSGEGPGGSDARSQTEGLSQGSYLRGSRESPGGACGRTRRRGRPQGAMGCR